MIERLIYPLAHAAAIFTISISLTGCGSAGSPIAAGAPEKNTAGWHETARTAAALKEISHSNSPEYKASNVLEGSEQDRVETTKLRESELRAFIGKKYWLNLGYDKVGCRRKVKIKATQGYGSFYEAAAPLPMEITDLVKDEVNSYWYKLLIDSRDVAYIWELDFHPSSLIVAEPRRDVYCVLAVSPVYADEELTRVRSATAAAESSVLAAKLRREQAQTSAAVQRFKKPGATIGMTAKEVIENTSWGKPQQINRTTTANGTLEQWVRGGGNYLYFRNGILYSAQH